MNLRLGHLVDGLDLSDGTSTTPQMLKELGELITQLPEFPRRPPIFTSEIFSRDHIEPVEPLEVNELECPNTSSVIEGAESREKPVMRQVEYSQCIPSILGNERAGTAGTVARNLALGIN